MSNFLGTNLFEKVKSQAIFCLHMTVPLKIRMVFIRKTETLSKGAYLYASKLKLM